MGRYWLLTHSWSHLRRAHHLNCRCILSSSISQGRLPIHLLWQYPPSVVRALNRMDPFSAHLGHSVLSNMWVDLRVLVSGIELRGGNSSVFVGAAPGARQAHQQALLGH